MEYITLDSLIRRQHQLNRPTPKHSRHNIGPQEWITFSICLDVTTDWFAFQNTSLYSWFYAIFTIWFVCLLVIHTPTHSRHFTFWMKEKKNYFKFSNSPQKESLSFSFVGYILVPECFCSSSPLSFSICNIWFDFFCHVHFMKSMHRTKQTKFES